MKKTVILMGTVLILLTACAIHDPVDDDYFSTEDRVLGKGKPATPAAPVLSLCENIVTLTYSAATDPDGDTLSYYIYGSMADPATFAETDFYDPVYYVLTADDTLTPVEIRVNGTGPVYLWYSAYDGGRESDHSPWATVTVPGAPCP